MLKKFRAADLRLVLSRVTISLVTTLKKFRSKDLRPVLSRTIISSATTLKKFRATDLGLVLSLSIICVVALGAAWFGLQRFEQHFAIMEANQQKAHWQNLWAKRLKNLEGVLQGESLSRKHQRLFKYTLIMAGAYRYKIYNADGIAVGASRKTDRGNRNSKPYFTAIVKKGEPYTEITPKPAAEVERDAWWTGQTTKRLDHDVDRAKHNEMRIVADTYVPFMKDGRFLGAIEVYADTTHAATLYGKMADYLRFGLVALFFTLFALSGFFIAQNVRKRNKDLKALREANAKLYDAHVKTMHAFEKAAEAEIELLKSNEALEKSLDELRSTQDELVRKNRLATLGQLTATVSHELRNPLSAVRTAAYLIARKTQDTKLGLEEPLRRVEHGVKRCDTIITELLDFTRTRELAPESVKLDDWVKSMVGEQQIPQEVKVTYDLQLSGAKVSLDASRFQRVMINMVSNAYEAMMDKPGEISSAFPNPELRIQTRKTDDRIEVSVIDNGPGIPAENLRKIFEPLFSTKSFGVGLGVPAVQQIMAQHGGGFEIASKEGEGATATAWLPLAALQQKAA